MGVGELGQHNAGDRERQHRVSTAYSDVYVLNVYVMRLCNSEIRTGGADVLTGLSKKESGPVQG